MSFPRYPAYKDSGVEWLAEVPAHWDVAPLKASIERIESGVSVNATDTPAEGDQFGVLKTSCVYTGQFDAAENKAVVDQEYDRVACPVVNNTLIVSRMNTPDLVGAAGLTKRDHPTLFLPDRLWQVFPKGVRADFLHYWTCTGSYRAQVEMACAGTSSSMQNLGQDDFRSFIFARPEPDEQVGIVTFLDHETAKIDALVAEQERLIELLKEKRQAVISHAVTKGLDPSVPMKDSGVEWLGEMPAHWEVRQVRSIASFLTSGPRGWSERVGEEGSLFVQSGDLTDDLGIAFSQAKRVAVEHDAEAARTRLLVGDVVVCITGAKTGNVAVCDAFEEDAYINQHLCLIRPKAEVLPRFLGVFLKSDAGQRYFGIAQYGLKQGLSLENVKATPVVVPPVSEQEALVKVVTHASEQMDQLIGEAVLSIELLRERRTALISAAVTGQIDVRSWAPAATAT